MAQKVPCVATCVGGIPEIIRDKENGILIPPKDPESIASALSFLFENPSESKRMAESAFEMLKERFSLQQMVGEYEEIYSRLIDAKRAQ
jgi:glycosyltransferase involved in cell wall biosynthesis